MPLREDVTQIYTSGLEKLNPSNVVENYLKNNSSILENYNGIIPIAFGKAAPSMMSGCLNALSKFNGLTVDKKPLVVTSKNQNIIDYDVELLVSSHPTPNESSVAAAKNVIERVNKSSKDELVLFLISGGSSSLLCLPPDTIQLLDKILLTQQLLGCGCSINELNIIRKHVSMIKGGRLAEHALPSDTFSLIISDVINDDTSIIASGPTIADPSTYQDVFNIFTKYNLLETIPKSILNHINSGITGNIKESPKNISNSKNEIICSNKLLKEELSGIAKNLGYHVVVNQQDLLGEAKSEAKNLMTFACDKLNKLDSKKIAIISGGETVVNIKGTGMGGRNQEFAAAFLSEYNLMPKDYNWLLLSVGTDGIDGPTDAAGGIIDKLSVDKFINSEIVINDYLDNNDSYNLLKKIDGLYKTGPSGNNVADIQIILFEKK